MIKNIGIGQRVGIYFSWVIPGEEYPLSERKTRHYGDATGAERTVNTNGNQKTSHTDV